MDRRQFLRAATATGAGMALGGLMHARANAGTPADATATLAVPPGPPTDPAVRKLIVVLFGGGTRSLDTIDDPEHRYIPRLWNEMIPKGTLFTNMRVEGKVVHPNSAGSIMTGHWE